MEYVLSKYIEIYPEDNGKVSVFNRNTKKTYLLGRKEAAVLKCFDGVRNIAEIHEQCQFYTIEEISRLAESFRNLGFFSEYQVYRKHNPFKINVCSWNPNALLKGNSSIQVFYKIVFILCPVIFFAGSITTIFLALNSQWVYENLLSVIEYWTKFRIYDAIVLILANFISLMLHEFAHAVTARRYNVNVPEMGIMIYLFLPTAYTNVSGMRLLKKKSEQIQIMLAGSVMNLGITGILNILMLLPGTIWKAYIFGAIVINAGIILFNMLIFVKYDGYYIAEILLEEPHLSKNAFNHLKKSVFFLFSGNKKEKALFWKEVYSSAEKAITHLLYCTYALMAGLFILLLVGSVVVSFIN